MIGPTTVNLQNTTWTRLPRPTTRGPHTRNGTTAIQSSSNGNGTGKAAAPIDSARATTDMPAVAATPLSTLSSMSSIDIPTSATALKGRAYWQELLNPPDPDIIGPKHRSASDAVVLRRKGHLKEQDHFIEFMLRMHETHTSLEVMQKMERWILEHRKDPRHSKLKRMVPTVGTFFTPMRLVEAFREYDEFFALSRRQYVPPNFAEIRHILNIAQVHSAADTLRLVTFDADGTLYADGCHMEQDNEMVDLLIQLMRKGLHVAIVTAAGYPGQPERFEQRMAGLLQVFRERKLPKPLTDRFLLMGGECNYLLRVTHPDKRLEFVPPSEWQTPRMMAWRDDDIVALLDEAQRVLEEGAQRLRLPHQLIRKERSVGAVPTAPTIYEVLEELALSTYAQLSGSSAATLPFCAFNGGNDVFVDIGNKSLGLQALMEYLGLEHPRALHVGDRFTISGNDQATRNNCSILWVANPEETGFFIKLLLRDIDRLNDAPYIE